jgi:hypothetical protein
MEKISAHKRRKLTLVGNVSCEYVYCISCLYHTSLQQCESRCHDYVYVHTYERYSHMLDKRCGINMVLLTPNNETADNHKEFIQIIVQSVQLILCYTAVVLARPHMSTHFQNKAYIYLLLNFAHTHFLFVHRQTRRIM